MPPPRTVVLGALAVGAQAFSSTPTTTTGGLPPCGTIDENGLNCQGLKKAPAGSCATTEYEYTYLVSTLYEDAPPWCDCMTFCCGDGDAVSDAEFESGDCNPVLAAPEERPFS